MFPLNNRFQESADHVERQFRRGRKRKKLTCKIRAAAEEIILSFGLVHVNPALRGVKARAGINQCSSLRAGVSDWCESSTLIYTTLPVLQLQRLMDCDLLLEYFRDLLPPAHFLVAEMA